MLQKQVGASEMSWVDKVLPSATEDEMEDGEAVDEVTCFVCPALESVHLSLFMFH